jgi:hypothetical protein
MRVEIAIPKQAATRRARSSARDPAPPASATRAIDEARDLAWAGQHGAAIDVATTGLALQGLDEARRLALLEWPEFTTSTDMARTPSDGCWPRAAASPT